MAERHTQSVKKLMKNVTEDKKDFHLALLQYRNTPVLDNCSLVQILTSRATRNTLLPSNGVNLRQKVVDHKHLGTKIFHDQSNQVFYYNKHKGVSNLKPLRLGTTVRIRLSPKSNWALGTVTE